MSEDTDAKATTATSGSPVQVGPGGDRPRMHTVTGSCLIVRLSAADEKPERFAVIRLDETVGAGYPGYAMDRDTGMLRVWDRNHTHLVPPDRVRLLRLPNIVRRRIDGPQNQE